LVKEKQILEKPKSMPKPADLPTVAPNEQMTADVKKLVELRIVDSAAYWLQHAQKGKNCGGGQVRDLLQKMAGHLDASAKTFDEAVSVLQSRKVFSSPAYWVEHATADRQCSGDNVRAVIRNFVRTTAR
jgi:hypothetical protein